MTDDKRDIDLTIEEAQALMEEGESVELVSPPYVTFASPSSITVHDLDISQPGPVNLSTKNISVTG